MQPLLMNIPKLLELYSTLWISAFMRVRILFAICTSSIIIAERRGFCTHVFLRRAWWWWWCWCGEARRQKHLPGNRESTLWMAISIQRSWCVRGRRRNSIISLNHTFTSCTIIIIIILHPRASFLHSLLPSIIHPTFFLPSISYYSFIQLSFLLP